MGRIERRLRADFDGSGIGRRNVVIVLARSPKSRLPEPERAVTRAPRQGTGLALKDAKESRGVTGVTTRTAETSLLGLLDEIVAMLVHHGWDFTELETEDIGHA